MRQRVLSFIVMVWGAAAVLYGLFGHHPVSNGAYHAGQSAAPIFGVIMFVVGAASLIKTFR